MVHRIESGFYPPGAEFDPNAPWNETEPKEIGLDVAVTVSLRKRMTLTTNNYTTDEDGHIEEFNDLEADVKNILQIPDGWELDEIENIDY